MTKPRSLLPREHGAYAELAFPLITGLALGRPTPWTWALGLAAVAFFLAHEPLAVLMGARGARLAREQGGRARRRLIILSATGLAAGAVGATGAGAGIWPSVLVPLVLLLLLLPLVLFGHQKTMIGEVLVVSVFASLVFPLGAASRTEPERMAAAAIVWWVSFVLGTLEVHAIKARHKATQRSQWTRWGSPVAAAVTVLGCGASVLFGNSDYRWPSVALLVPALAILIVSASGIHPRNLKRVGWTLVGSSIVTFMVLVVSG